MLTSLISSTLLLLNGGMLIFRTFTKFKNLNLMESGLTKMKLLTSVTDIANQKKDPMIH